MIPRGEYSAEFSKRSESRNNDNDHFKYVHEGEKKSMLKRSDDDVKKILNFVKSHMSDPFSDTLSEKLINISNGVIAPNDVQDSLLKVVDIGKARLFDFVSSRLDDESPGNSKEPNTQNCKNGGIKNHDFHDPITQVKLKTFSDLLKPTTVNYKNKSVKKVISPDLVFQRALAVSSIYQEVNLVKILSIPLTDVPTALFNNDGSKRITAKSDMLQVLEKEVKEDVITRYI